MDTSRNPISPWKCFALLLLSLPFGQTTSFYWSTFKLEGHDLMLSQPRIGTFTSRSAIACAIRCIQNDQCSKVSYNQQFGTCSVSTMDDSVTNSAQGTMIYTILTPHLPDDATPTTLPDELPTTFVPPTTLADLTTVGNQDIAPCDDVTNVVNEVRQCDPSYQIYDVVTALRISNSAYSILFLSDNTIVTCQSMSQIFVERASVCGTPVSISAIDPSGYFTSRPPDAAVGYITSEIARDEYYLMKGEIKAQYPSQIWSESNFERNLLRENTLLTNRNH